MRQLLILSLFSLFACTAQTQNNNTIERSVGGNCEGCEAALDYNGILYSEAELPGFTESENPLILTGTVFLEDGKTPAPNIIIYAYHTNDEGIYPNPEKLSGWAGRHGRYRGWVKTDAKGKYTFKASLPASYPNSTAPQHIHLTVKEKGLTPYYIGDVYFNDDINLTDKERTKEGKRAGSGLVIKRVVDSVIYVERNIYLGLNIPNY